VAEVSLGQPAPAGSRPGRLQGRCVADDGWLPFLGQKAHDQRRYALRAGHQKQVTVVDDVQF